MKKAEVLLCIFGSLLISAAGFFLLRFFQILILKLRQAHPSAGLRPAAIRRGTFHAAIYQPQILIKNL